MLTFFSCSKEKSIENPQNLEKISKKDIQKFELSVIDFAKYQKYDKEATDYALSQLNSTFGFSKSNEKIFKNVGSALNYSSLVKAREKTEMILSKVAYSNNIHEVVDVVSDITDLASQYESPQTVYHYHHLGVQLENNAIDFEQENQNSELSLSLVNNFQNTLYNTLSGIEASVNNDISLASIEKQTLLNVLLFLKTSVTSSNFGSAIFDFVNSNSINNIFSNVNYNSFIKKGFFSTLFKAVVSAVIVVASAVVGYGIGAIIGGLPGGILGATSGAYWGLELAMDLFWGGSDIINNPYNESKSLIFQI